MKPTLTISESEIREGDLLFYRPSSFFGMMIKMFDSFMHGRVDIAFSHVAIALEDHAWRLRRFDAMEGKKTGFRRHYENCYVFRMKFTLSEIERIRRHCLAREGSKYDRKGIASFFSSIEEDEFRDYCSELIKNALSQTEYGDILSLEKKKLSPLRLYILLRSYCTFIGLCLWN